MSVNNPFFEISLLPYQAPRFDAICQRKAEVSPSVRNRDVMLWFRECV